MKNKTKTYILLLAFLAIWGIIGLKVASTLNSDDPKSNNTQDFSNTFTPKGNVEIDTFSIQTLNRDPFLGTLYSQKKVNTKIKKPKETLVWPSITYHGTIAKQHRKSQIFIISINGQQHLMTVGLEINNIKLLKANNKEVLIYYSGAKKTIKKA